MKRILLAAAFLLFLVASQAQTRWTVSCNGKAVLKNVSEGPQKNTFRIKRSSLSKTGNITITFASYDTSVIRTVMADDSSRVGLKSWEEVNKPLVISNADLKVLLTGRNRIDLYVTQIPRDPEKAALVRMRPIHLCTIRLQ